MAFDGQNIWLADYHTDLLYCIDPETGNTVKNIPAPAYWPEGLAWDGEALWNADVNIGILEKLLFLVELFPDLQCLWELHKARLNSN